MLNMMTALKVIHPKAAYPPKKPHLCDKIVQINGVPVFASMHKHGATVAVLLLKSSRIIRVNKIFCRREKFHLITWACRCGLQS